MPVPEDVIFGPKPDGEGEYTYRDVRVLDATDQMHAFKCRLDKWLLEETDELCKKNEDGGRLVYSPFPLAVMTCVAVGTLGEVFYGDLSSDNERRSEPFRLMLGKIDAGFSTTLPKKVKKEFEVTWPESFNRKKHKSAGHIIYTFYRNTLIHGFRGQMVFITEQKDIVTWGFGTGAILLNPFQLWEAFKATAYEACWELALSNKECKERQACLNYIAGLVGSN